MKFLFLLGGLFLICSARAEFQDYQLKRLDDSKVIYYVDRPQNKTSYSFLIFLQGSECKSIYGRPWMPQNISEKFGFGVILVEKYGITKNQNSVINEQDCTKEFYQGNSINQRIHDYLRVMQVLRNTEKHWDGKVFIMGGSEGGAIAPIVASYVPETKKVIMLSGGIGWNMEEELQLSLKRSAEAKGMSNEQIEELLQENNEKVKEIKSDADPNKMWLGNSYKWWNSILWVRPLNYLVDLNASLLMVHGTEDLASPVESARDANKAFEQLGKTNLTYWELDGLDHSYSDKSGNHLPEVLEKVFEWILNPE